MSEGPPPPEATKAAWRRWARTVRSSVDFATVSTAVCASIDASDLLFGTVLTFLAMGDEIDLAPLRRRTRPGVRWAVTRTPDAGPLTVHPIDVPMERHPMGYLQPRLGSEQIPVDRLDALLVPGLVFDRGGGRLGRGKGYIDGLLSGVRPDAISVGVAPDALVVDRLPMEDHDRRVTHLATEGGVIAFSRP